MRKEDARARLPRWRQTPRGAQREEWWVGCVVREEGSPPRASPGYNCGGRHVLFFRERDPAVLWEGHSCC